MNKTPNLVVKYLFHGTQVDPVSKIITGGFLYTKKAFYGMGIYFSDMLDYVSFYAGGKDFYTRRDYFGKILPVNTVFSCVSAEVYYSHNKKRDVFDFSLVVPTLNHFPTYDEIKNNYPDKMVEIINKIRENPVAYADFIEDSIKYITEIPDKEDETKTKLVFKKKVKVALNRGESAFHEAAEILRKMEPMPPLEFNGNICIPLPQDEEELRDPNYLREQVKIMQESNNIDLFFKDLIKLPDVSALLMVVDDSVKNSGRKRQAILNKDFKYIGINSHFVGKTFLAYFAFSK